MSPPFPSVRPSSSAALKSSLISSGAQAGEGLFPCTPAVPCQPQEGHRGKWHQPEHNQVHSPGWMESHLGQEFPLPAPGWAGLG